MNGKTQSMIKKGLLYLGLAGVMATNPGLKAQQQSFGSLEEILTFADQNSATAKISGKQSDLAELQSLAAKANLVNLRGSVAFNATDNLNLPVNFIPAEIFGGPAGVFREVQFGQQYVSVASITPQLDLVNPNAWARLRSAGIGQELTATNNQLSRRNLHESLAAAYANYRSLEAQRAIARQNILSADSIRSIAANRFEAGTVRKSDLNNAEVNRLNLIEFEQQLALKQEMQRIGIQTLLGIGPDGKLTLEEGENPLATQSAEANSGLLSRQAQLQLDLQQSEMKAQRMNFLPSVSMVAGFNWQQNSNDRFFDGSRWIHSDYVGLRISMPLPTETRLWSGSEEARMQAELKAVQAEQTRLQEQNQNMQLELEVKRAESALENAEKVLAWKTENYNSLMAGYREGIIGADVVLTAFTDLLNARMTAQNASWNLFLQYSRAQINRDIQ